MTLCWSRALALLVVLALAVSTAVSQAWAAPPTFDASLLYNGGIRSQVVWRLTNTGSVPIKRWEVVLNVRSQLSGSPTTNRGSCVGFQAGDGRAGADCDTSAAPVQKNETIEIGMTLTSDVPENSGGKAFATDTNDESSQRDVSGPTAAGAPPPNPCPQDQKPLPCADLEVVGFRLGEGGAAPDFGQEAVGRSVSLIFRDNGPGPEPASGVKVVEDFAIAGGIRMNILAGTLFNSCGGGRQSFSSQRMLVCEWATLLPRVRYDTPLGVIATDPGEVTITGRASARAPRDPVPENNERSLTLVVTRLPDSGRLQIAGPPIVLARAAGRRAARVRLSGKARDARRVEVAVARRVGRARVAAKRGCRWLRSARRARFRREAGRRCVRPTWLKARGNRRWRLGLPKLPPGRYTVLSRAVGQSGFAEITFSKRDGNRISFRVKKPKRRR